MDIGYKLLRKDGSSLRNESRTWYPLNEWVTVPGNGAYVAVNGGLHAGGDGPMLATMECEEPTGAEAPVGVKCYRRVRRLPTDYAEVARSDADCYVRLVAIGRLDDQSVLAEIARSDADWNVRRAAVRRLDDQAVLAQIARTDEDRHVRHAAVVRRAAVRRLDDPSVLAQVVRTDADEGVRR